MITDGERISIQNDLVTLEQVSTSRQVSLADFLEQLNVGGSVTFPTLPRTAVFVHQDSSTPGTRSMFFLTEIPAGIVNLEKNLYEEARRYRLAMPWTYIWFAVSTNDMTPNTAQWAVNDYRCFHKLERYNGINEEMIVARLPNVYSDGRICWGATGADPRATLGERLDQLTNEWYLSRFNADLDGNVELPYGAADYARWIRESRENPTSWRNWPEWTDVNVSKYTVDALLRDHGMTARTREIVLPNSIPSIPMRLTYGSWEEWFRTQVPAEELRRAEIAIANVRADGGIPEPTPVADAFEDREEIGIRIDYRR